MAPSSEQENILSILEDSADKLRRAQINFKKASKTRLTKGYIQTRISLVKEYWTTFKNAHDELIKSTPKAQKVVLPYFVNEEFYANEELYNDLLGELNDLLDPEVSNIGSNLGSNSHNTFVHLPKIQLPTFTSTYEGWPAFKDLFNSLVNENSALSDVQKLHYLKTSVSGDAEVLLKHIQVTSANYEVAWEILDTRYGNKRMIINNIMKKLFNQKRLTSQSALQIKSLIDTTVECLNNLQTMEIQTRFWDLIIIHLLVQKLDPETHKDWEEYISYKIKEDLPTWEQFQTFMETKFRTLELVTASTTQTKHIKERSFHVATPVNEKSCTLCKENHTLCHCKQFTKMEPTKRIEYVKHKYLCYNCLAPGHTVTRCRVPVSCRICKRRHHSLLHENKEKTTEAETSTQVHHAVDEVEVQVNTMISSHYTARQGKSLLATALVETTSEDGHTTSLRALVDPGSHASFISERATQLLQLRREPVNASASGLGSMKTRIKHAVKIKIGSKLNLNFSLPFQAYVVSKVSSTAKHKIIPAQQWPHLNGLKLADPNYLEAGPVDMLLGVKQYNKIIQDGLIKGPPDTPSAQNTSLGWIIFGDLPDNPETSEDYHVMHVEFDELLKTMWKIEPDDNRKQTREEQICEEIYKNTTKRNEEGRYIVNLPFNTYSPRAPEGNTKNIATRRFLQLERKFRRTPNLKEEFLTRLQQRPKWLKKEKELAAGNRKMVAWSTPRQTYRI